MPFLRRARGRAPDGGTPSAVLRDREDAVEPVVALTFDDGPSDWTEPILNALREEGAGATFFVVGRSIRGREAILRRAVEEGHELGNHSTTHPDLSMAGGSKVRRELASTNRLIEAAVGVAPRLFRPPYLRYNAAVLRIAGEVGLEWTVLASPDASPKDFKISDAPAIAEAVVSRARPGAVIGLHDGRPPRERAGATLPTRKPTAEAVPEILRGLNSSGYRVVTVSELFVLGTAGFRATQ